MTTKELINKLKESASIVTLLDRLGHQPAPRRGREAMYISMLRDSDSQPSFCVDDKQGVWYDHGSGEGGNIIDFGLAYWKGLPFTEIIRKIADTLMLDSVAPALTRPPRHTIQRNYIISQTKPLGSHPAISQYLKSRGIFDAAKPYLHEVYYSVKDDQGTRKKYFAAGWLNERSSWEIRNRFFKGCLGSKAITFIPNSAQKVAVFEGFLDFLSWKTEHPDDVRSVIVLNAVTLLKHAIDKSQVFSEVDLYFDRDRAGMQATSGFIKSLPYAIDRSAIYAGFNDYNDKLKAMITDERLFVSAGERSMVSRIKR